MPVRRTRDPRSGFTLLEITFVLLVMGLVLLMAAGSFDALIPRYALRSDARAVGEQMRMARGEAAGTGHDVYLAYDLKRGATWIWAWQETPEEERGPGRDPGRWEALLLKELESGDQFSSVVFGGKTIVETETATVRVTPLGTADHHIVNLENEEGLRMAVKLNGITGVVSFYEDHLGPQELLRDPD
jgi:prepilin-type N-terminal cleavage/methylation domain-containing protein